MPFFGGSLPPRCVFILFPAVLFAQRGTGEIRLDVRDPSGSPVIASGLLENASAGVHRRFQTTSAGTAALRGLAYGTYRIEISGSGFETQSLTLDVQSSSPVLRTIRLVLSETHYKVDVVATTPLEGSGQRVEAIPSPVQTATSEDIRSSGALDLSDFLNRRLNAVYANEIQGNPYQQDINYRGYTASPLLGTPQGLSIYMDGVRLNQPFGDVVSWDLIPKIAISETTLLPGSNPLFGLNTLGGALSLQTKTGYTSSGTSLEMSGGSFGRKMANLEHGGTNSKGLDWYLAANLFFEDGWRESSPSDVRQFFGRAGWSRSRTSIGLSVAYANNSLTGNGIQEQRFLERDYTSVYTKPDITNNRSPFVNLSIRHTTNASLTLSGNVYYRSIRTNIFNGDINENSLDQSVYQPGAAERAALAAAGYTGFPVSGATAANTPFPYWRCIAQVLLNDEPGEKCNGLLNRSNTRQHDYGASGQGAWSAGSGGWRNQLIAGAAYDRSTADFLQSTQLGYLNPDRGITGLNAFADGVTGGDVDGEPFDNRVGLHGLIHTSSVYASDTFSPNNQWNFTFSGRYNRTIVTNTDRITPGGGPRSLDGHNVFDRFNPAAGVTYAPARTWSAYFSFSQGSRAPTSVELGCADPQQPCKLPNAMAGDPPLDQVVASTWEAGVRGGQESRVAWNAGWFRADNRNDILFVASEQTGFGYFKNFGKTRRQGLELGANSRLSRLTLGGGYTLLDATYQSPELVDGSSNSAGNAEAKGLDGSIQIEPGNRIPLVPRHMFKAYADLEVTKKLAMDLSVNAFSSAFARGNEDNLHQPDGVYYLGPGSSPGYAVANLGGRYQVRRHVQLFVQVNNLFNRKYYSAAQLGPTGFTAAGAFIARPFAQVDGEYPVQHATFYAPGAPRGIWGGLKLRF
ncbi:MAG: TonB-dependent receptor [Bryobacterales bacterium]|nr:TonB-dependent receptor [Bryobacterales bacterium]